MSGEVSVFERVTAEFADRSISEALEALATILEARGQFHEMFEALKMKARSELGLPLRFSDLDELEETRRDALERGLLDACRRVGILLLRQARVREAWNYLRAVGDRAAVAKELGRVPDPSGNVEEWIEVLFYEAVDPARGIRLILQHCGTCDAITALETVAGRLRPGEREAAVRELLAHVHCELLQAVRRQAVAEGFADSGVVSLAEWATSCPRLFAGFGCHLDATHLTAVVRMARTVTDHDSLMRAWELTEYGRRLDPRLQYASEPPFEDTYAAHGLFFDALLGRRVDAALEFFHSRAVSIEPDSCADLAFDCHVHLLDRLGRFDEALRLLMARAELGPPSPAHLAVILKFADHAGRWDEVAEFCRRRGDVLGYATCLAEMRRAMAEEQGGSANGTADGPSA